MLVLHIACTPLAGAPIRIVNSINKYSTKYKSRLITLSNDSITYKKRTYPEDIIYDKNNNKCISLIRNADILHFHHFFNIDSIENPFKINFKLNSKSECKFIRHFHTNLDTIASWHPNNLHIKDTITNDKLPKIVIPHGPERHFLDATILPNIIPNNEKLYLPVNNTSVNKKKPTIFFSTTSDKSAFSERWETKAKPEVIKILNKIQKLGICNLQIVEDIPYEKCLKIKQSCDIVIGDVVTGSYHLTELEALSMGKCVICYLDGRTISTLFNLANCKTLPFINSNLECLQNTLEYLCTNQMLCNQIGKQSRKWIENYYDEKKMVNMYIEYYNKVIENKLKTTKVNECDSFINKTVYDFQWSARKKLFKRKNLFNIINKW